MGNKLMAYTSFVPIIEEKLIALGMFLRTLTSFLVICSLFIVYIGKK